MYEAHAYVHEGAFFCAAEKLKQGSLLCGVKHMIFVMQRPQRMDLNG